MNKKKFAISASDVRKLVRPMGGAFATDRIMVEGKKIGYMYRESPDRTGDSGWRFFFGDEDQAYLDDPGRTGIYEVNTIANYDPDIIPYLESPAPCAFEKVPGTKSYRPFVASGRLPCATGVVGGTITQLSHGRRLCLQGVPI